MRQHQDILGVHRSPESVMPRGSLPVEFPYSRKVCLRAAEYYLMSEVSGPTLPGTSNLMGLRT